MSRDGGFDRADVATGYFRDPKIRRLTRLLNDPEMITAAIVVHMATVLGSWEAGERVLAEDVVPDWLALDDRLFEALRIAGLLDSHHRIPRRSWASWAIPVIDHREALREKWRRANRIRREKAAEESPRLPRGHREDTAAPVPSLTLPSRSPRAREGERSKRPNDGPTSIGEALAGTPLGDAIAAAKGRLP